MKTDLQNFQGSLLKEVQQAFHKIIQENPNLTIYHLGLFYSGPSWSYLFPTFSSLEGLDRLAKYHAKHSSLTIEQEKEILKWSIPDSIHHDDEQLGLLLPNTSLMLEKLVLKLNSEDILQAVLSTLLKLKDDPIFINKDIIFSLSSGDQADEAFLASVELLNGVSTSQLVRKEKEVAHILKSKKLQELDYNQTPPPASFNIKDFDSLVEAFNPVFLKQNELILLNQGQSEEQFVEIAEYEDLSLAESRFNRLEVMSLLIKSEHFEEIDKLYGHFIGKNFEKDDFLPTIARSFLKKIEKSLREQFPTEKFILYYIVDRNALYYMSFCKDRGDGYRFEVCNELPRFAEGVEEIFFI